MSEDKNTAETYIQSVKIFKFVSYSFQIILDLKTFHLSLHVNFSASVQVCQNQLRHDYFSTQK